MQFIHVLNGTVEVSRGIFIQPDRAEAANALITKANLTIGDIDVPSLEKTACKAKRTIGDGDVARLLHFFREVENALRYGDTQQVADFHIDGDLTCTRLGQCAVVGDGKFLTFFTIENPVPITNEGDAGGDDIATECYRAAFGSFTTEGHVIAIFKVDPFGAFGHVFPVGVLRLGWPVAITARPEQVFMTATIDREDKIAITINAEHG